MAGAPLAPTSLPNSYRYTNTPLHYVYGPTTTDATGQMLQSNVVLKRPAIEADPTNTDAYYTSSSVDSEWGYRVNVHSRMPGPNTQINAETAGADSYMVWKNPSIVEPRVVTNLLAGTGRLFQGDQGFADYSWLTTSQGVDTHGKPYAPDYGSNNTPPHVTGLRENCPSAPSNHLDQLDIPVHIMPTLQCLKLDYLRNYQLCI